MEKMFQKNKYYILKRRKLEKYTSLQTITNFLNEYILILEVDNENIRFRRAFENTDYSKPLKEIENNYISREIIDREYLDLEIQDNFQCKRNPNLISLHQNWEYEYQKKHLFALAEGKIIKQIRIPYLNIDNFYLDVLFFVSLISLIIAYLIITNNFIFDFGNKKANKGIDFITFAVIGIITFIMYLNNYDRIKEYERELEYRIEKQRYE